MGRREKMVQNAIDVDRKVIIKLYVLMIHYGTPFTRLVILPKLKPEAKIENSNTTNLEVELCGYGIPG